MITQVLKNPHARQFFSFLIGLGLAIVIFHRPQRVTNIPAVPPQEMMDKVVRMDGKCYRFSMEDAACKTTEYV